MGHIHLPVIPRTRKWRDVVELLAGDAAPEDVVTLSAIAAEKDFARAASNPLFVEAVRLLLGIPHAARSSIFAVELQRLGLDVADGPELFDILTAVSKRIEDHGRALGGRDDFGELSTRALLSTLSDRIGTGIPSLFGSTPADVQIAARSLSWKNGIADLTRAYFGHLIARSLGYWLDRTLSAQIGSSNAIDVAADRSEFDVALQQYVWEATRMIREFAPGWYGKRIHEDGGISSAQAAAFAAVAFKKITEELRIKRGADV